MKIEANHIYQGDCLDLMPWIADASVDAIICDLPYGVLNRNNRHAKWDRIIPFEPLWAQYERIIKPNGVILLFGQGMFTSDLMQSNRKLWRYNLIWDKGRGTGFLNANRMPMRCHEDICVFYKSLPVYNPQMIPSSPFSRNHGKGKMNKLTNNCYGTFKPSPSVIADEKYPSSILYFPKGHNTESWLHPTQKPVDLLCYLIRTYTKMGGVILDNTMGSGTTCVAAIMEKRQYIGMEKEPKYFSVAEKRIRETKRTLTLDFGESL